MARAFIAALLSGLVMPGLGQLYNHHLRKGGLLVALMSILFVALIITGFLSFRDGVIALGENIPAGNEKWQAVFDVIATQNQTPLFVVVGLMACVWIFSWIDAFRGGLKYQAEQIGRDNESSAP